MMESVVTSLESAVFCNHSSFVTAAMRRHITLLGSALYRRCEDQVVKNLLTLENIPPFLITLAATAGCQFLFFPIFRSHFLVYGVQRINFLSSQ